MATAIAEPIDGDRVATPDQPRAKGRVESLDLIRGLAVMGIVLANLNSLSTMGMEHSWPPADGPLSAGEKAVWLFEYLFIDGKLRGLFSLLFGAGMIVFLERARARGAPAISLQLRRLFWLLLFGLAHFYLLFDGDILHNYAVAGLIALLFLRVPPKWMLGIAATVLVAFSYFPATGIWDYRTYEVQALAAPADSELRREYQSEIEAERSHAYAEADVLREGSLADVVAFRVEHSTGGLVGNLSYWLVEYLSLMLIGASLFRLGFFSGEWNRRRMLGWGLAGIALSAAMSLPLGLWTIREGFPRALHLFVFYGPVHAIRLPMILGYAAVLVAVAPALLNSGVGRRIAATGRMAFSNYIGTSLVMALVFQGWGLGLFGQLDKVERLLPLFAVWVLMLIWSPAWLARFRFGPLEWLWRCLTYWKRFPIRRDATV